MKCVLSGNLRISSLTKEGRSEGSNGGKRRDSSSNNWGNSTGNNWGHSSNWCNNCSSGDSNRLLRADSSGHLLRDSPADRLVDSAALLDRGADRDLLGDGDTAGDRSGGALLLRDASHHSLAGLLGLKSADLVLDIPCDSLAHRPGLIIAEGLGRAFWHTLASGLGGTLRYRNSNTVGHISAPGNCDTLGGSNSASGGHWLLGALLVCDLSAYRGGLNNSRGSNGSVEVELGISLSISFPLSTEEQRRGR